MAPSTMRALVVGRRSWLQILYNAITKRDFSHGVSIVNDHPTPQIRPNEILIRVRAVALNPSDWKHIDFIAPPNSIIGCDYAGEVVEVGPEVPPGTWRVGERAAGVTHGGLCKDEGSFAEYVRIPYDLAWRPPTTISDHEATTYGVSAITAMMALYYEIGLPWPDSSDATPAGEVLVYAASTAAGLFALQMYKHAAVAKIIATCSPHSFELVKKYGADVAIDYRAPSLVEDIVKEGPNITSALDNVGNGRACVDAIAKGPGKGKVITLTPFGLAKKKGIESKGILAYTLKGQAFQWFPPLGPKFAAKPEDRAALAKFYAMLPSLIDWLRPLPIEVIEGGWDGLLPGLDLLRKGKVSGKKLVVDLK